MAARSRAGTMTGGWLTIRYCPPASSPSLDRACRLSRVCAFAAFFSARFAASLGQLLLLALLPLRRLLGLFLRLGHRAADRAPQLVLIQVGVPDVHCRHLRERGHGLPVGRHRRLRRRARVGLGEPVVAGRDQETRRHPLHVVLERPRQRLVEVVQVEQQPPFGRGEQAEVRQVRVAAQLGIQAGHRGVLQVRRHDRGRAPVEGERRDHHPAMPDRHQIRLPGQVLRLQQRNRVRAAGGRAPARMTRRRRLLAGLRASSPALIDARMRNCLHRHPAHLPFRPGQPAPMARP